MAIQKLSALKHSPPARAKHHAHGRQAARAQRLPWPWIALAVVLLVGGGLALLLTGAAGAGRASGRLTAAQQMYDFGQVPIHGGLITTRFPLTVEGETLVTELSSS